MWFRHKHLRNIRINGTVLKAKAKEVAVNLTLQFAPLRNGLNDLKTVLALYIGLIGEARSVDLEEMEIYRFPIFQAKIAGYEPREVFNTHKSGQFCDFLPNKSLML